MINGKKVLAVIPARGGSKGVKGKNIRPLGGKPLIIWTIEQAKISGYIDTIIISTDDKDIAAVASEAGVPVPFLRPKEIAGDQSSVIDAIKHVNINVPGYDIIVLLQPTSPFRQVRDIDSCIKLLVEQNGTSVVSVVTPEKSPYWSYEINDKGILKPLLESYQLPRQQLPPTYTLNGAVYVAKMEWLMEQNSFMSDHTLAHLMSNEHSIDIDSEFDFWLCEKMLEDGKITDL